MNGEKEKNKLMHQGKGLAAAAVILAVLAVVLIALLIDISFVPNGEMWEEIRASMTDYFLIDDPTDEVTRYSDKEMWDRIKDEMKETGIVPVKSGLLCWGMITWQQKVEAAKEAEREEQLILAQETAEKLMEIFDDFLSEKEITSDMPKTVAINSDGWVWLQIMSYNTFGIAYDGTELFTEEEQEELRENLSGIFPEKRSAAAEVVVCGGKCTAAVYAPDVNNLYEGTDFPYFDENGHFDEGKIWGCGMSEVHSNGFIIGYVDENGVKP